MDTPPASGKKIVHFIRHGEARHNVASKHAAKDMKTVLLEWKFLDSGLTQKGKAQASNIKYALLETPHPELVVVSPLTRALQTATEIYHDFPQANYLVLEDVREHFGQLPCDKRRSTKVLQEEFPHFDFSTLCESDTLWREQRESGEELRQRVERALSYILHIRPEKCIAVVTHNGFLKTLLQVLKTVYSYDTQDQLQHFSNAELRTVLFENGTARVANSDSEPQPLLEIKEENHRDQ